LLHRLPLACLAAAALASAASVQTASAQTFADKASASPLTAEALHGAPALGAAHARLTGNLARFASGQVTFGANVVTATFEAALIRSRDGVQDSALPIPDNIRKELLDFYPAELLDKVRYTVGDVTPDGLAGFAIRNGNAAAVTLIDTIVFKNETHVQNLALWAHELRHVEQYEEWGVDGFAARYAFGWADVEADATSRAKDFVAWYKDRIAALK
jgi:hypothetical protein